MHFTNRSRYLILAALGALQEAVYIGLVRLGNLQQHLAPFLGWIGAAALFYLIGAALVLRPSPPETAAAEAGAEAVPSPAARGELRLIVLLAVLFRLTLLPLQPTLSTALMRAHWDGKIQHGGFNPYQYPPQSALFNPIRSATDGRLANPGLAATAPPLAELLARWDYDWTAGPRREKLLYLGFDLMTIVLLAAELRRRGLPRSRVLLYAWAPLGILETAGNGQVEIAAVFFAVLAIAWLARNPRRAGLAMIAAMATGFMAWAVAPAWFARTGRKPLAWMAILVVLLVLPFIWIDKHAAVPLVHNLAGYLARWSGANLGPLARGLLALVPAGAWWRLAPSALAVLLVTFIGWRAELWSVASAAIGAALLCAPMLFPWYALWLLPVIVLFPRPAAVYFTIAALLGYAAMQGAHPGLIRIEYWPAYALLLWQAWRWWMARPRGRALAAPKAEGMAR